MSAADLRNELRELRKEHIKPVSKMHKMDVAAEIQRLKLAREETPAVAATKGAAAAPKTKPVDMAQDSSFEKVGGTKKGMERKTARKAYEEPEEKPMAKAKAAPKKVSMKEDMPMKEEKKMPMKAMKEEAKAPAKKGRPAKGSKEAAEHMARIRAMRGKKKEE